MRVNILGFFFIARALSLCSHLLLQPTFARLQVTILRFLREIASREFAFVAREDELRTRTGTEN